MPVWGNRLSPVFDSARTVLIADIESGVLVDERHEALGPESPVARAQRLADWRVDTLICGAISDEFSRAIGAHRIRIIPFITGDAHQVLDAFRRGAFDPGSFRMPGCGRRRRGRCRGGRR